MFRLLFLGNNVNKFKMLHYLLLSCPSHNVFSTSGLCGADDVFGEQDSSSSRQQRRWAIVCGSPQSHLTDSLSLPLFPFVRGEVLPATSSPPHLISLFHPPPYLFFFQSSSYPAFLTSLLTQSPISALASLVSSCPPRVTLLLSSVVCHPPSFLRALPTVVCSSPVSLSSSSALLSLPLTPPFFSFLLLLFFIPTCFRTLVTFVVVRSLPRFPFRTGLPVSHKCS